MSGEIIIQRRETFPEFLRLERVGEERMEILMNMPELIHHLDYTSTESIEAVLSVYFEIEQLAYKGYPAVVELYVELKGALGKLNSKVSNDILDAVIREDSEGIKAGSKQLQKILLGS